MSLSTVFHFIAFFHWFHAVTGGAFMFFFSLLGICSRDVATESQRPETTSQDRKRNGRFGQCTYICTISTSFSVNVHSLPCPWHG
jgi:hypothetical protein